MNVALKPRVTPRETEIIQWMSQGKTAFEIGIILGISPITVTTHITSARGKLDALSSTHLVAKAIRGGIIE